MQRKHLRGHNWSLSKRSKKAYRNEGKIKTVIEEIKDEDKEKLELRFEI